MITVPSRTKDDKQIINPTSESDLRKHLQEVWINISICKDFSDNNYTYTNMASELLNKPYTPTLSLPRAGNFQLLEKDKLSVVTEFEKIKKNINKLSPIIEQIKRDNDKIWNILIKPGQRSYKTTYDNSYLSINELSKLFNKSEDKSIIINDVDDAVNSVKLIKIDKIISDNNNSGLPSAIISCEKIVKYVDLIKNYVETIIKEVTDFFIEVYTHEKLLFFQDN